MLKEISKKYNPKEFEDLIYSKWEKSGLFNPDNLDLPENALSYTIILPPPNITDKLHMGHSAMIAIEDLLIRLHRQRGYRTLWLPGTDHAAIATQNAVEKKILKEKGLTRHDLGKERFLKEIWSFISETQATILNQIKKMGASLDWSRLAFTLDKKRKMAVEKMFIDMYKEGVIYRGERIVNWCPRCQSTLSDDEIEYREQKAKLYTFYYNKDLDIAISTTRPETKLGDTAIAVNPKDNRYTNYLNNEYKVNFLGIDLKLKIIADNMVDMNFGSGALGLTPAHSMVDWQLAKKHRLNLIKVINEKAEINSNFSIFSNLKTFAARKKIVEKLKENNLMIKEEEIDNNLSICYRCDTAIEPLLSKQWFVAVDKPIERLDNKSLKEAAILKVENKEIEFIPNRFKNTYLNWMNNLHDWCISRQIDFGHEIPAWYKDDNIYVGVNPPADYIKDNDTLDTWFSSAMWTFSTLGWPENYINEKKINDLAKFHPSNVLETGYEIISLWVSRMVMMSLFALNEVPFKEVYLHGMILDAKGKKMSKSKGNGIDPLDLIDKYGADAVRLSLLTGITPGNDSKYSEEKVEAKRNFVNKLWNISRFIISQDENSNSNFELKTLSDYWIFDKYLNLVRSINIRLDKKEFSLAVEELIEFTWSDLANWYLEIAKFEKNKEGILKFILIDLLKLWHPFIPFVTESIWQSFNKNLLMIEKYPEIDIYSELENKIKAKKNIADFNIIKSIIVAIRDARSQHKIEANKKIEAIIIPKEKKDLIIDHLDLIKNLRTNIKSIKILDKVDNNDNYIYLVCSKIEIYLSLEIDTEKEKKRLENEIKNIENIVGKIRKKIDNPNFLSNAPQEIVKAEKNKLKNWLDKLDKLNDKIKI